MVDRTNQLAFLSLADGQSNTYVGLNAGNRFPAKLNCFLGAGSGANTRYAMTSVYAGALSGQNSNRIGDLVALGYGSAQNARDCYSTVLVGSGAGSKLVRSELNCALGHQSFSGVVSASRCVAVGAYSSRFSQGITDNCYVGYACGQSTSGSNSVYIGSMCAQIVTGNAVTSVGAGSLANTEYASNVVVCGALGGENAENIHDVVMAGYGVGRDMSNVSSSLVLGTGAGQSMMNSSFNVVAGHLTGQVMVNSSFNTLIGGLSATNVESKFTTVVGSGSMNRRNNQRVEFSNCVIVGESIRFDLPLRRVTMSMTDILLQVATGTQFNDPTHSFPLPFLELVDGDAGSGSVTWKMDESLVDDVLLEPEDRDVVVFASLQITEGTWTIQWFALSDETLATFTGAYACELTVTSGSGEYTVDIAMSIDGIVVASKSILVPQGETVIWMDLTCHHRPIPSGTLISWNFVSNGASLSTSETELVSSVLTDDIGGGFIVFAYATTHPRSSYVHIAATSADTLSPKSIYAVVEYNARVNEQFTSRTIPASSLHSIDGAGVADDVDTETVNYYELMLVNSTEWPGFTAARYTLTTSFAGLGVSAYFSMPQSGSFGFEWLATEPTTSSSLGDGYVVECSIDDDAMYMTIYSSGSPILQCTQDEITAAYPSELSGRNVALPFDLAPFRMEDEAWVQIDVVHTIGRRMVIRVLILGYDDGAFTSRLSPSASQQYMFTINDTSTPTTDPLRDLVSVFASGTQGNIAARDFSISVLEYRGVPLFERCVFIGSNFTVDQDTSNTFVLSLGPEFQLLNGTPEKFTIFSESTSVNGSLVVGSSATNNHIAFRGLQGDGYMSQIPTTYIGERVYDAGTERTELLLFKGEDAPGALGPDRVRILSGEFHVETFASSVDTVYTYNRSSFMDAGNAGAYTVMVANENGIGILKTPDAGYELDINGSNARKLTGTTWLEGSDERIKTDIENADTEECCRIMKKIPLKRFKYTPSYTGREDNAKVYGWLGQDVEKIIENAVTRTAAHGYDDFRTLDSDQLLKVMWGAIQNVMMQIDALTEKTSAA